MCTAPGNLDGIPIGCRSCWQCRSKRVNNWVGRAIAERLTSDRVDVVTLTYGHDTRMYSDEVRDHPHARALHYEDVQGYLMRVRNNSDGLRFFCTGEYGSLKGRAHWHLIAYWKGEPVRNIEHGKRFHHWAETPEQAQAEGSRYSSGKPLWDEGFSFITQARDHDIRYVAKYLLKDANDVGDLQTEKRLGLSCKPPLGDEWFRGLARRHCEQGLAPQNFKYELPGVYLTDGETKAEFWLQDRSARNFLDHFVREWRAMYGNEKFPPSPLVEAHMPDLYDRELAARQKAKSGKRIVWLDDAAVQAGQISEHDREVIREEEMRRREKAGKWLHNMQARGLYTETGWSRKDHLTYLELTTGAQLGDAERERVRLKAPEATRRLPVRVSRKEAAKRQAYATALLTQRLTKAVTDILAA